jgi:hypothetical protein
MCFILTPIYDNVNLHLIKIYFRLIREDGRASATCMHGSVSFLRSIVQHVLIQLETKETFLASRRKLTSWMDILQDTEDTAIELNPPMKLRLVHLPSILRGFFSCVTSCDT